MKLKSKKEWLLQLRRYSTSETVEKMAERISDRLLDDDDYLCFQSAVDHRLAELVMDTLYDKIPTGVWHYVK